MKILSIFLLFLLFSITAFAQITIETERDENGNVLFFSKNPEIVPYSVILNFSTLQNLTSTGGGSVLGVAMPGRIRLATLKPTLAGQGTNYSFTYSFAKGNVYGKNKTEPVYLVPVKEGVKVPYGVKLIRIKVEGRTPDGDVIYHSSILDLENPILK